MLDKIRKLLALARNNSNEAEASSALAKARALMLEHGVTEEALDAPQHSILWSSRVDPSSPSDGLLKHAAAVLCGTEVYVRDGLMGFVGRPENIEMSFMIADYLSDQVTFYYKQALPTGLTQSERARYRKSFKWAAAQRLLNRAKEIAAQPQSSSSYGLILVDEVRAFLKAQRAGTRETKTRTPSHLGAALQGALAADSIKLRKDLND